MSQCFRYEQLARELTERIRNGLYRTGERLPGIRPLSREFGVSISTVQEALHRLEEQGRIHSRPRSGFYVSPRAQIARPEPPPNDAELSPAPVTTQALTMQLLRESMDPGLIHFGTAIPHPDFLPAQALARAMGACARRHGEHVLEYAFPPGEPRLRRQLARHLAGIGTPLHPDELVITNGCHEALILALRALTRPGDIVIVESPTYYGLLQAVEASALQALEIPTHPEDGISLEAIEFALERWPVKACIITTNFSNPLGCSLSMTRKQQLVELLARRQVALIEDDIYGDLNLVGERPGTAKSFDRSGNVLYCASVSKTLSPGLRIGWIAPGRHLEQIRYLKFVTSIATPTLNQLAVADLLASGAYERHLRGLRAAYGRSVERIHATLERHLDAQARVSHPRGGFQLWVQFPPQVDGLELYRRAHAAGMSIAPGVLFSVTDKYRSCIRLNAALPWSDTLEQALIHLCRLAAGLAQEPSRTAPVESH